MFEVGVEASGLPEPEMIPREHRTRVIGIAGSGSGSPSGVSLDGFQPADQIPRGAPNCSGPGQGIRLFQVQPAYAGDAGDRLGSNLDEIILAREGNRAAHDWVLGGCRNRRPAALRSGCGLSVMTADPPGTHQEDAPEHAAPRQVAA